MSLSPGDMTKSDGYEATYNAASGATNLASSFNNDMFYITGSATKTIKILRIGFSAKGASGGMVDVQLVKRSTADTGGNATSTAKHLSSNPTATATVLSIPTGIGVLVGIIRATKINSPNTSASGAIEPEYIWSFTRPSQALVLRGTAECVAIAVSNGAVSSTVAVWVEWTEE